MSEEQHLEDIEQGLNHHTSGSEDGDGGKCLNRHIGKTPMRGKNDSCSHRWQAYEKMKGDRKVYDWPSYESLSQYKSRIRTARKKAGEFGNMFPAWYTSTLRQPTEHEWDLEKKTEYTTVDIENFWEKCYVPYWHEAHHIVPNSTLRNAIVDCSFENEALIYFIRRELIEKKYNLNSKINMIMLPMDIPVAKAMKLPRHRQTATVRSHTAYSDKIESLLSDIFSEVVMTLDVHEEEVDFNSVKTQIEDISKIMYEQIKTSENATLDNMTEGEFKAK